MNRTSMQEIECEIAAAECGCGEPEQHDGVRRCEAAGWADNGAGGQIWDACPNMAAPHEDYCATCLEENRP